MVNFSKTHFFCKQKVTSMQQLSKIWAGSVWIDFQSLDEKPTKLGGSPREPRMMKKSRLSAVSNETQRLLWCLSSKFVLDYFSIFHLQSKLLTLMCGCWHLELACSGAVCYVISIWWWSPHSSPHKVGYLSPVQISSNPTWVCLKMVSTPKPNG